MSRIYPWNLFSLFLTIYLDRENLLCYLIYITERNAQNRRISKWRPRPKSCSFPCSSSLPSSSAWVSVWKWSRFPPRSKPIRWHRWTRKSSSSRMASTWKSSTKPFLSHSFGDHHEDLTQNKNHPRRNPRTYSRRHGRYAHQIAGNQKGFRYCSFDWLRCFSNGTYCTPPRMHNQNEERNSSQSPIRICN